jgi:hypothetical protein
MRKTISKSTKLLRSQKKRKRRKRKINLNALSVMFIEREVQLKGTLKLM